MNENSIQSINTDDLKFATKDYKCAPSKKFENGSCISLNGLVKMAEAFNNIKKENVIKLHPKLETLNPSKYKKYLVNEFYNNLKEICDDQLCWVKTVYKNILEDSLREELQRNTFRPKGPKGKFTWLNTFNINDVMAQYEQKYKEYKFLGAVPIDFADLDLEISNYDLNKSVQQGKSKLGVVFNLDEHYKSGSHWVGSYIDLLNGHVYFFDSYGIEPESRIRKFLRKCAKFIEQRNISCNTKHNKTRHQYKNSECGVYSINFILRLLKGETFNEICDNITSDSEVNKCRNTYFL